MEGSAELFITNQIMLQYMCCMRGVHNQTSVTREFNYQSSENLDNSATESMVVVNNCGGILGVRITLWDDTESKETNEYEGESRKFLIAAVQR